MRIEQVSGRAEGSASLLIFSLSWLLALIAKWLGPSFVCAFSLSFLLFAISKKSRLWRHCLCGFFLGLLQGYFVYPVLPSPPAQICVWQVEVKSIARVQGEALILPRAKVIAGWTAQGQHCGQALWGRHVRIAFSGASRAWARVAEVVPGRQLRVSGSFHEPRGFHNPGAEDPEKYYMKQGLIGKIQASKSPVLYLPTRLDFLFTWFGKILAFRLALNDYLHQILEDREAGLVAALLLGEQKWLDDQSQEVFSITGCSHIFAASGFNVALVLIFTEAFFYAVLRRQRWLNARFPPRSLSILLSLPFLLAYMVLTGCADASVRAALMAACLLLGKIIERKGAIFNILGLCLFVDLLFQPWKIWSVSWELSYASTFMILAASARFKNILSFLQGRHWFAQHIGSMLWVTAWALLGSAPLLLTYFKAFGVWGLATNLAVLPLVSLLVLPLALGSLMFWGWAPSLFTLLLQICGFVLGGIEASLARVAQWPMLVWRDVNLPWQGFFIFFFAVVFILGRRSRQVLWVTATVIILLLIDVLPLDFVTGNHDPQPYTITFLDVGHGDAVVIQTPDAKTILIDAGGSAFSAEDQNVLLPFFKNKKITRIDLVILSHAHPDHYGGLRAVFEKIPVSHFIWNGEGKRALDDILWLAQQQGVLVTTFAQREQTVRVGISSLLLFNPFADADVKDEWSRMNNRSLVVFAILGGKSFLFSGDIEKAAEAALTKVWRQKAMPHVDVLKVPHHGSRTSSTTSFLQAIAPKVAVVSSGLGMRFEFPHAEISQRYQTLSIPLVKTKVCGAIWIKANWGEATQLGSQLPCKETQENVFFKNKNEITRAAMLPMDK